MEEKNDRIHSSLESSEQEFYAFILGESLRVEDNHEQVLKIYDSIPRHYSQSQFDGIKERARIISELPADDFVHLKRKFESSRANDCALASCVTMTQDPEMESEFLEVGGDVEVEKQPSKLISPSCVSTKPPSIVALKQSQAAATVSDILNNNSESFTVPPTNAAATAHSSVANSGAILGNKKMQSQPPNQQLRRDSQSSGVYESCDESKDVAASQQSTKPRKKKKKSKNKKQGNGLGNCTSTNGSEDSSIIQSESNVPSLSNGEREPKTASTKDSRNGSVLNSEISFSASSVNSAGADPVPSPSYFNISPSVGTRGSSSDNKISPPPETNYQSNHRSSEALNRLSPSRDIAAELTTTTSFNDTDSGREEFQEVRQRRPKNGKNATTNNSPPSFENVNSQKKKSNSFSGFNNPRNGIIPPGQPNIAQIKQSNGAKTTEVNGQSYANRLKSAPNQQSISAVSNGVSPNSTTSYNSIKGKQQTLERVPRSSAPQHSPTSLAANNRNSGKMMPPAKNAPQTAARPHNFQEKQLAAEVKPPLGDSICSRQKEVITGKESDKETKEKAQMAVGTESNQVVDMPVCIETSENSVGKQNAQLCFQYENSVNKSRCASTSSVSPSFSSPLPNPVKMCNKGSSLNHANITAAATTTTLITNSNQDPTALQVTLSSSKSSTSLVTTNTTAPPSDTAAASSVAVLATTACSGASSVHIYDDPSSSFSPALSTSAPQMGPDFTAALRNVKSFSSPAPVIFKGGRLGQLKFGDFDINTINGAAVGDFNLFEATAFLAKTWGAFANRSNADNEWYKSSDTPSANASDPVNSDFNPSSSVIVESHASACTLSAKTDEAVASAAATN